MAAITTRREARARVIAEVTAALDREIPLDESVPLKGRYFIDFEDAAERVSNVAYTCIVEQRAALDNAAEVHGAGGCPRCGSDRVYLTDEHPQRELISPRGPVVLGQQRCRCRACGESFSPSGA